MTAALTTLPLAATKDESSNFLVSPNLGLMIWTLLAFFVAFFILRKYAWPQISAALEKRQRAIEESIETAERTRTEAQALLAEYRERLREARSQADDIVVRARKAAESTSARPPRRPAAAARSCSSRPGATSRPRPGAPSPRSAARSRTSRWPPRRR